MKIKYKYRLNKNWKDSDSLVLEGINVTREWSIFDKKIDKWEKDVFKIDNKSGILDCIVFDWDTQKDLKDFSDLTEIEQVTDYSRKELNSYDRQTLNYVARRFNIDPAKKNTLFLVRLIMEAQEKNNLRIRGELDDLVTDLNDDSDQKKMFCSDNFEIIQMINEDK